MRRYNEVTILAILNAIDYKINRISLIMKYLNLSGTSARDYLDYLVEIGVIEKSSDGEYKLTEKGRRVLELLREKRKIEVELALVFIELADLIGEHSGGISSFIYRRFPRHLR